MSKTRDITVTVNGDGFRGTPSSRGCCSSDFLRDTLGLTGTHVGCEHGVCGACTVLLDGDSVRSCLMFAVQADGCRVETVEGLGRIGSDQPAAGSVPRASRAAMRLLHARHADDGDRPAAEISARDRRRDPRGPVGQSLPLHRLRAHRRGDPRGRRQRGEDTR